MVEAVHFITHAVTLAEEKAIRSILKKGGYNTFGLCFYEQAAHRLAKDAIKRLHEMKIPFYGWKIFWKRDVGTIVIISVRSERDEAMVRLILS